MSIRTKHNIPLILSKPKKVLYMCKMSNFLFSVHNLENNQVENKTCNHKKKIMD